MDINAYLHDVTLYPILKRGQFYYHNGNVLSLESNDNIYTASVEGTTTKPYTCSFFYDGKRIKQLSCNCPAFKKAQGPCKHLVAAMLKLSETLNDFDINTKDIETNRIEEKETVEKHNVFDSNRHYILGAFYEEGGNIAQAINSYEIAASQKYVKANIRLAKMYINGEGVERDYYKGCGYYLCAAEDGDQSSRLLLKCMMPYENEKELAPIYVLEKAEAGSVLDQILLAKLYIAPYGEFYNRAANWLQRALEKELIPEASLLLINLLLNQEQLDYNNRVETRRFCPGEYFKDFITIFYGDEKDTLLKEELIVTSPQRMNYICDLLFRTVLYNISNYAEIKELLLFYLKNIVNPLNSYVRKPILANGTFGQLDVFENDMVVNCENEYDEDESVEDECIEDDVDTSDFVYEDFTEDLGDHEDLWDDDVYDSDVYDSLDSQSSYNDDYERLNDTGWFYSDDD